MADAADHVRVGGQGVKDGLLGGLHDGGIERVEETPRDESQGLACMACLGSRACAGGRAGWPLPYWPGLFCIGTTGRSSTLPRQAAGICAAHSAACFASAASIR